MKRFFFGIFVSTALLVSSCGGSEATGNASENATSDATAEATVESTPNSTETVTVDSTSVK
jgi:hypothetical protein